MESRIISRTCRRGFVLPLVLIITAVGLLFGAGALLLFKYQCQHRIDRQHELEKVYAVRSALNYIRKATPTDLGTSLNFHTASERDLALTIKPAKTFFPTNLTDASQRSWQKRHFVMQWGDFSIPPEKAKDYGGYNQDRDYEYGAEGVTNLCSAIKNIDGSTTGLVFNCEAAQDVQTMRCWVNIGMGATGGWLQEEYGRRYCFWPEKIYDGDVVRLWLIKDRQNAISESQGKSCGWPPEVGERSLVMEIEYGGMMKLWEYDGTNRVGSISLCSLKAESEDDNVGVQLANDKAVLFTISSKMDKLTQGVDVILRGYNFSAVGTLSTETYDYFKPSDSSCYDSDGRIKKAPEMRGVFEFVADPDKERTKSRILKDFKVTPGYQYGIYLEYPAGNMELATVAQRMGEYKRTGSKETIYNILTYDTHGTEHKGFRLDERQSRNGGVR